MVTVERLEAWAKNKQFRQIAVELIRLERERLDFDLATLSDDPESGLIEHPEITVQYDSLPPAGCSVFGYYEHRTNEPSVIHVHPSATLARDSFTILHELGHHVQRHHSDWMDVRFQVPIPVGSLWEERVADAFAAELLMPAETFEPDMSVLSARSLSDMHSKTLASRAAVAMRALELAPKNTQVTLVVADAEGVVSFAQSTSEDVFRPARGHRQPSIASLVTTAQESDGFAEGEIAGLDALSGWRQSELKVDLALDHTRTYAFAVIRPARRYGNRTVWERREHDCPNAACASQFAVDETVETCAKCGDPKCPDCRTCSCEPSQTSNCPDCFIQYSAAEERDPRLHECL